MNKVEAYRCEKCKGKGCLVIDTEIEDAKQVPCPQCKGTTVVWLTKIEAGEAKWKWKT